MPPEAKKTPLLTVKEAAAQIGLSETAVYTLCDAGEIETIRVGLHRGRIKIEPSALEAYLAKGRRAAPVMVEKRRRRVNAMPATQPQGFSILRAGGWDGRSELTS